MLSEFENNLNAELPILMEKRVREISIPKIKKSQQINSDETTNLNDTGQNSEQIQQNIMPPIFNKNNTNKWKSGNYLNNRVISVIDEASV